MRDDSPSIALAINKRSLIIVVVIGHIVAHAETGLFTDADDGEPSLRQRDQAVESRLEFRRIRQGKTERTFEDLTHLAGVREEVPIRAAVQMMYPELIVAQCIAAIGHWPRRE